MGNFERLSVLVIVVIIVMIVVIALVQLTGGDEATSPTIDDKASGTLVASEPAMGSVVIPPPKPTTTPSTTLSATPRPTLQDLMGPRAPGATTQAPPDAPPAAPIATPTTPLDARPEPSKPVERVHVVQSGETIAKIAKLYYPGTASAVDAIVRANPAVDPARMRVGTKLTIPALGIEPAREGTPSPAAVRSPAPSQPSLAGGTYIVRKGDTLAAISRRAYGTTGRWQDIWLANYEAIGDDVDSPAAGTRLTLPK
jgi:nucleoid-associated protein YgaU